MSNFREGLNALREISDPEKMKMALERITGKKLADYEGIDALVASLMGYYNDEVKKKQNKQDNALETTAKEIVPAINENYEKIKLATTSDVTESTNIWSSNILDTRNDNYPPSHYGVGVRHELKLSESIELNNVSTYAFLTTIKKWRDSSAGFVEQIAFSDGIIKTRQGDLTTDKWGEWRSIYTDNSVQSWRMGTKGWVKYPDGRLEQWFSLGSDRTDGPTGGDGSGAVQIDLPIAFINTDYRVVMGAWGNAGVSLQVAPYSNAKISLSYNKKVIYGNTSFFAVGWWK